MHKILMLAVLACWASAGKADGLKGKAERIVTAAAADYSKAVYIRDASADSHNGTIHYWTNAGDSYLGWRADAGTGDECRWQLIDCGTDAAGNCLYKVQHIASGLYVEGLRYITGDDPDKSDVVTPLVSDADAAHALTFEATGGNHYFISDATSDRANGYMGEGGKYNYAMCGNYGNVGGYWRDYTFEDVGYVQLACEWEIAPAPKGEELGTAPIPEGEEVYVALAPNWSNHGQYLWTSDGETAGLVHLDPQNPQAIDFAAAAFIKVPTDDPARFKFYHISSQRYLYGLNYIADSPESNPLEIYDGDPWDNRCVLTDNPDVAHALLIVDDYTYTTHTRTIDYAAKGWTVIKDPVAEEPGDACHYYGGEYGYCVYSLYKNTNYEFGGFGAVLCGPNLDFYSADPWIIRTRKEMAAHLGLPNIDSQIPVGIGTVVAPKIQTSRCCYDLAGRIAKPAPQTIVIENGKKVMR